MREESIGIVIGVSIGGVIGLVLAIFAFYCHRYHRKRPQIGNSSSRRADTIPIRAHGADSCTILSDSTLGPESPIKCGRSGLPYWPVELKKSKYMVPESGLPVYKFKDVQKPTHNFTTVIRQDALGAVFKAQMSTGDVNGALCGDLRVKIALNGAKGLDYLHDGVADFRLSREKMVGKHAAIRGTFGYLDPEYISSGTFTKKSDVYSFGVLLFEIIAGRNPQQGLMEYVELARMNIDGKVGWEEIVDSHLQGNCHVKDVNEVAGIAYKCINRAPNKFPSMRDIVQVLTRFRISRHHGNHHKNSLSATDEVFIDPDQLATKISVTDHRREESKDNPATEVYDV